MLLRITDVDKRMALKLTGVAQGTYNGWLHQPEFVELYRRLPELSGEYKLEAIKMLHEDNQNEAVGLVGDILSRIREEVKEKHYDLIRSRIACDIVGKLLPDLNATPQGKGITFEQRIAQIFTSQPEQIVEGQVREITEGEVSND